VAGIGSAALSAGPLLGGALVELAGWRAVFYVNLPVVAVAFAAAVRLVPETPGAPGRRIDLPGVLLGAALLGVVTFALIDAGRGGAGARPAAALGLAVVLLAAFLVVERRAADPMLPPALFRRPAFTTANAVAGTMNLCTLGLLFVFTLYLQRVLGRSALGAGVTVLPLFVPLSVLAPPAGRLVARVGPRVPMAAGLLCAATGIALLVRLQAGSGALELLPAELLWGIGLGILTPAVVAAAIDAVPTDRAGLASAVNNTARQAGGAIGIAAFGALAGPPGARGFVGGFHTAAVVAAALYVAAAAASLALVPARASG
jgi:DHA2 family methylenomycin A resistance protein-like MFS transporter